jgi:serine phosphatase RsbU (regulator of sigma subunit)
MKSIQFIKLFFLMLLCSIFHTASTTELGVPFIANFSPRDYNASNQNWCVAQDQRGLIYVGNSRGVLEFDGVQWRLISLRNNAAALSIAINQDNTIFVGGKGDFGFLQPDSNGQLTYTSLKPLLAPDDLDFSDVWEIIAHKNAIYFRTAERLFRYTPSSGNNDTYLKSWRPKHRFHVAFRAGDEVFVRQRNVGLYNISGDDLDFIPGSEVFADESIYSCLNIADNLLLLTRTRGLYSFDGRTFSPFESEAGDFIKKHRPIHSTMLNDNLAAIATTDAGIIFINALGDIIHHVDKKEGLRDNTVWFLSRDRDGGLWCALNNGISRVEFPSALTLFDDRHGLDGVAQDIIRHNGSLYVAASPYGVFQLQSHSDGSSTSAKFSQISGISTQTWHFASVQNRLLVAANNGIYEIKNQDATPILTGAKLEAAFLKVSRYDSTRVFAGLFDGLAILKLNNKRWTLEQRFSFNDEIRSIIEEEQGLLWLGTRSSGVHRIRLSEKSSFQIEKNEHYTEESGLPAGQTFVFLVDDAPIFTTEDRGVFSFDEDSQKFSPSSKFGHRFSDGSCDVELVVQSRDGQRAWLGAAETGTMTEMMKSKNGGYSQVNNALARLPRSAVRAIYEDNDGVIWISTNDALCRYDEQASLWSKSLFSVHVRRVTLNSDSLLYGGAARPSTEMMPQLSHNNNAFRIEYAAASFDALQLNSYQIYLEGFDKKWSQWTRDTWKEFTNLSPGVYKFRVRAKNVHDAMSREDSYSFQVLPPWYRTLVAYIGYAILLGGLVFAVDRFQRRRLMKRARARTQRALLEAENQRRIEELEQARNLQLSMLPKKVPQVPGISIAVFMKTATEVGGDYYDFSVSNGELTGAIGDATGHGINAGMMVSITKGLFVSEVEQRSVLDFFKKSNSVIRQMHLKRIYMALSVFKIKNKILTMSSAGMPPTYRYQAANNTVEEISPKGMPLGATDAFPYKCEQRELEKNDILLFMSDGFPELFNQQNKIIGYDAVPGILHKNANKEPQAIIDTFVSHIKSWAQGRANDDDITFVVLKIQ